MSKNLLGKLIGHGRFSRYVPLVLCAVGILILSSGEASMAKTSRFIRPLLEFLLPTADDTTLLAIHGVIRKIAHLSVYALLAMTAARAFRRSSVNLAHRFWPIAALVVVLTIAAIDEFNQSLNPARTGSPIDVTIDLIGGMLGITVSYIVLRVFGRQIVPDFRVRDEKHR